MNVCTREKMKKTPLVSFSPVSTNFFSLLTYTLSSTLNSGAGLVSHFVILLFNLPVTLTPTPTSITIPVAMETAILNGPVCFFKLAMRRHRQNKSAGNCSCWWLTQPQSVSHMKSSLFNSTYVKKHR